jgi:hypothetical protein
MKRKNIANELVEAMREAAEIAQDKAEPAASPSTRVPCRTGSEAVAVPTAPRAPTSP